MPARWDDSGGKACGRLAAAAMALVVSAAAPQGATPARAASVDQLACAAAKAGVRASGRYDKRTGFGIVPIIPPRSIGPNGGANCPIGSSPSFYVERTRDEPSCVLGYSCERRDNR